STVDAVPLELVILSWSPLVLLELGILTLVTTPVFPLLSVTSIPIMPSAETCCKFWFTWVCCCRLLNWASSATKALLSWGLDGSWFFNCAINRVMKSFSPSDDADEVEEADEPDAADELLVLAVDVC